MGPINPCKGPLGLAHILLPSYHGPNVIICVMGSQIQAFNQNTLDLASNQLKVTQIGPIGPINEALELV